MLCPTPLRKVEWIWSDRHGPAQGSQSLLKTYSVIVGALLGRVPKWHLVAVLCDQ